MYMPLAARNRITADCIVGVSNEAELKRSAPLASAELLIHLALIVGVRRD
jgi:hypothetical protein